MNVALPAKNTLETILIVEDDTLVLGVIRAILERAGFCVLTAANSTEAIQKADGFYEPIHLLLSDVMMPDMSGPVISRVLKKYRPEMRVMLMSGYSDGNMLFLKHGRHFIDKPFLPAELVERVNELLHTPERIQEDDHFDTRIKPKRVRVRVRGLKSSEPAF
jgi:two-component system, cell cycle sensor histidine kinase and response regulator CckA